MTVQPGKASPVDPDCLDEPDLDQRPPAPTLVIR